jgi:hypothetical protein
MIQPKLTLSTVSGTLSKRHAGNSSHHQHGAESVKNAEGRPVGHLCYPRMIDFISSDLQR